MLRVLAISLLGLIPLTGHAGWDALADSRIKSALGYLIAETPKRAGDLQRDNLNLWQPGLSVGAQVELAKNWKLRLDVDRYRPKFPGSGGRDNLDTLMIGVQYRVNTD